MFLSKHKELIHKSYTRGRKDLLKEIESDFQENIQSAAQSAALIKFKLYEREIDVIDMYIKVIDYDTFNHASHNLKNHSFLKEKGGCDDWVITTAFYSALKFIEGSLFPFAYKHPKTKELTDFKSYNNYKSTYNRFKSDTPHSIMRSFVKENTNQDIHTSYEVLYNECHNSRYKNYQIEEEILVIVYEALEEIKLFCIENQK